MSAKYLLPCHDGKTMEVTTADAGRMVVCPCGKKVQVPTLRGVQGLAKVVGPESASAKPAWSARQGAMFSVGLVLVLVGLLAFGMLYNNWRQIDTAKPDIDAELLARVQLMIEQADPASTLDGWQSLRNTPLPDRQATPWELNRKEANKFVVFMSIAGAIAVIGLGLAIAGPLARPATPSRAAKQRLAARVIK